MKLVSESLNELYKFEKKSDSLVSLGVGKKMLITKWLDEMGVKNYIINDDYTIDVNGNVNLFGKGLVKFPDYIQFNEIYGWFACQGNQLISLKGCPKIVSNTFTCRNNNLESLKYSPLFVGHKSVGNYYDCTNNKIRFTENYVKELCNVKGNIYV